MEIENVLENNINNNNLEKNQNNFLNTDLGKMINNGIDVGIRALFPDYIEEVIINIKNAIINNDFEDCISKAINSAIEKGKKAINIISENFTSIGQAQNAIKQGNLLSQISKIFDQTVNNSMELSNLDDSIKQTINNKKEVVLSNVDKNINNSFKKQLKTLESIEKYTDKWNKAFNDRDLDKMEKNFKKIEKKYNEILPLDNIIKECRRIENIENIIKNKEEGHEFDFTKEELELAEKLTY